MTYWVPRVFFQVHFIFSDDADAEEEEENLEDDESAAVFPIPEEEEASDVAEDAEDAEGLVVPFTSSSPEPDESLVREPIIIIDPAQDA